MARTIRVFWPNTKSRWKTFNWGGVIDAASVIHISASEGSVSQSLFGPLSAIERTRGDATIFVKNVHPHGDQGGVEFFVDVDWPNPLNIVTDITVMEPAEQGFIVG